MSQTVPAEACRLRDRTLRIRKTQGRLFAAGHDTQDLAVVTTRPGAGRLADSATLQDAMPGLARAARVPHTSD